MTDGRAAYDDQLPWLEPVDDEDAPSGVSARKMLAALSVVLLAALIIAGTFFWLGRRDAANVGGEPELIRAEPGPYKVRPDNPGGLDVAGDSQTAYETSAGEDRDSQLNLDAVPEAPVARPPRPEPKQAAPSEPRARAAEPATPAPAETEPAATGGSGSVIQLGAYRTSAQAQRGWDALSARFPVLTELNKMIVPFSGGYRLRAAAASPDQARQICQTLQVAGENCFVAR
ncbi:MAG TPA: SPOR domain-containing protein [Sphingomicrobium sp.]|nr:SPOR domain-containing protein [Sphingomicrobium sp.]